MGVEFDDPLVPIATPEGNVRTPMMPWILADCTKKEKRVIVGLYAHGDSASDLAAALGITPEEVERIRQAVVERVKQRLGVDRAA